MPVKNGDTVRVHYTGKFESSGEEFDSSRRGDGSPLEFKAGASEVIPGFEAAVLALDRGDSVVVTVAPEDGYGPRHDELVQKVGLGGFDEDCPPELGGLVTLVSPEGERLPATVAAIEGDEVTLDFNHPLAGETLIFEIEVLEIVSGD
jgi:peptidylprolyl isomerase